MRLRSALVGQDLGDVSTTVTSTHRDRSSRVLALRETVQAAQTLAEAPTQTLIRLPGQRPLVIGGDCSILLGIVPALRRAVGRVGLLVVDGHPDYLDGPLSDTGETADMELAVLTGQGAEPLVTLAGQPPIVAVGDVVLLGHRTQNIDAGAAAELARPPNCTASIPRR